MAEDNIQHQNSEESKNDKIWWYLLLGLLQDSTESKWLEYTKQLMYSNRFSSSHEVIDLLRLLCLLSMLVWQLHSLLKNFP